MPQVLCLTLEDSDNDDGDDDDDDNDDRERWRILVPALGPMCHGGHWRPSAHTLLGTGWCGAGLPPFPTAC